MKTKTYIALCHLALVGAIGFGNTASGNDSPTFKCQDKTLAVYSPGPHWNNLEQVLPEHLGFIANQIKSQNISAGGPTLSAQGDPSGAFIIFNLVDAAQVKQQVEEDPLVKSQVANYEIKTWRMCQLN